MRLPVYKEVRNAVGLIVLCIILFFAIKAALEFHAKREERREKERQEQEISQFIQTRLDSANQDDKTDPFGDDNIVRVLLIGLDKRVGQTSAHCDAIQLFEINKETNTVSITAVPRGTYSPLPPGKGTTSSDYYVSNACGLGGIEYGIKQIESILGQQADYLAFVGFSEALGVFRTLKLPTTETLEWLRHRQGYAIGEPQRAHNHSTFLKKMLVDYLPTQNSAIDTPLQYLIYNIIETDLSFSQTQQIIDALIAMELSIKPERITLAMKPFYSVQDIAYDPTTLDEYRHRMFDPISNRLSQKDFTQLTTEEIQAQIVASIEEKKNDAEFMAWAWENDVWHQIQDETIREEIHHRLFTTHLSTLPDVATKQQAIADYILEMDYLGLTQWSDKGKALLSELLNTKE
jgi:hypothetical protein